MLNDKILGRYLKIGRLEKALKEEREALRDMIMQEPDYQSPYFKVQVTNSTRTTLESIKFIRELAPNLYSKLELAGCIKQTEFSMVTVKELSMVNLDAILGIDS